MKVLWIIQLRIGSEIGHIIQCSLGSSHTVIRMHSYSCIIVQELIFYFTSDIVMVIEDKVTSIGSYQSGRWTISLEDHTCFIQDCLQRDIASGIELASEFMMIIDRECPNTFVRIEQSSIFLCSSQKSLYTSLARDGDNLFYFFGGKDCLMCGDKFGKSSHREYHIHHKRCIYTDKISFCKRKSKH